MTRETPKTSTARAASNLSRGRAQEGFALVVALLALVLLTFLGLTLAATTSTELQIATNYRWSEQARHNAEAGIEFAKSVLAGIRDWRTVLPPPRVSWTVPSSGTMSRNGTTAATPSRGTRDFENFACDRRGNGMGYGAIFDGGGQLIENLTTLGGNNLAGAVTVWVRRPVIYNADGTAKDYDEDNDNIVLVAEGVAPFVNAEASSVFGRKSGARQVVEVMLSAGTPQGCGGRRGQAGAGPEGANAYDPCEGPLGSGTDVMNALVGATNKGTGAPTPNP